MEKKTAVLILALIFTASACASLGTTMPWVTGLGLATTFIAGVLIGKEREANRGR